LCIQQGALKAIHPEGVFFLPAGKDVRIVDWIRFINYILMSIKYFVNGSRITRCIIVRESYVSVDTVKVIVGNTG